MPKKVADLGVFPFIIAMYVTALILRPVLAAKIISFYNIDLPAGILIFPLSFICNDIFTEVYGYERSRKIIQSGLAAQILACLVVYLAVIIPGADFWHQQEAYSIVLGQNLRLAAASLCGCYFGEITNSLILSKLKFHQRGCSGIPQQSRFVLSTFAGEFVDSAIYVSTGFIGIYPADKVIKLSLATWIGKCSYEILFLPISTKVCQFIKHVEQCDHLDVPEETNYSLV